MNPTVCTLLMLVLNCCVRLFSAILTVTAIGKPLPTLKPVWRTSLPLSWKVRILMDRDSVYVSEATEVTCLAKTDGHVRWKTTLSPGDGNRYALPAEVFLCDGAICVGRYQVPPIVDVLDPQTGKIRLSRSFGWQRLQGILGVGRFAILCTCDPNFVSKVQLHELDMVNGLVTDSISLSTRLSLWRPYYIFGGELFRFTKGDRHAELTPVTLFEGGYDSLHEPRHIWLLPGERAFVTSYDRFTYSGFGTRMSMWDLHQRREVWTRFQDSGNASWDFFVEGFYIQGSDVWVDSDVHLRKLAGQRMILDGKVPVFWQTFESHGRLMAVEAMWGKAKDPNPTYCLVEVRDGEIEHRVASLPRFSDNAVQFSAWGSTILANSAKIGGDLAPHTLTLFRFP